MKRTLTASVFSLLLFVSGGGAGHTQTLKEAEIATLYKASVVIENARILIATFNSSEKKWRGTTFEYNWENCLTAARLFRSQPGARTTFWCEKGEYRE